jgi:biopolymer transport protein ExbB
MNALRTIARWNALARCTTCLGLVAILVLGSVASPLAAAQEKTTAVAPVPADKTPADKTTAAKLTAEQASKMADAALAEEGPGKKDAKSKVADAEEPGLNLVKVVREGGIHMWAVYAILAVSVIAVAFVIERALGLRRSKVVPGELMAGLRAIAGQKGGFDPRQAYRLCRQYPSSAAVVVKAMLQKVGRPMPEVEHAVADAGDREASRLYANVRWQSLTFNLAPMLGLAGTVHGVIIAF